MPRNNKMKNHKDAREVSRNKLSEGIPQFVLWICRLYRVKRLKKFFNNFNQQRYLDANLDVVEAISSGKYSNAIEHFVMYGYREVRRGRRSLCSTLPLISNKDFVRLGSLSKKSAFCKLFRSSYQNFLEHGYGDVLDGDSVVLKRIYSLYKYRYIEPGLTSHAKNYLEKQKRKPKFAIVLLVDGLDFEQLELSIGSIQRQWYDHWEAYIVNYSGTQIETHEYMATIKNEPRVKIVSAKKGLGKSMALNKVLSMISGEYVALMDSGDLLTPDALYEVVKCINASGAEFIYSDEDEIDSHGSYVEPHFKADYAPDMLLSQNYISRLAVIKKSLIDHVGGWSQRLKKSQEYDLYLKVLEKTGAAVHIPKVLYHARRHDSDESYDSKAQEEDIGVLESALKRRKVDATIENGKFAGTYRVRYAIKGRPLVSIIIPFKDKPKLLKKCIGSILKKSMYQNYEIIGISNSSKKPETYALMQSLQDQDERISFYEYNIPFNYSTINNYAIKEYAKGEHLVLLNNDIEIISEGWIESLLEFSQREDVGAVGAKLYYPDDTIQHAGVIMGVGGLANHSHRHFERDAKGYQLRPNIIQNLSAVTGACLMVKKSVYDQVNGLNEKKLPVAFNDVDFCLRLRESGYLNVYTPHCEAYHHESISRGKDNTPKKIARAKREVAYMRSRHKNLLTKGDPYYNINLTKKYENFGINVDG